MPRYWMISDRVFRKGEPTSEVGQLSYWISDAPDLTKITSWTCVSAAQFKKLLIAAADQFPAVIPGNNANQKHVGFFVHGYNNGFADAAGRYQGICSGLFEGDDGLGLCISFDWPSLDSILGYLPDRAHAEECACDFATVLDILHDWLLEKQQDAATDPAKACKAKISVIAHSMGNFLFHRAMATNWTRHNQPLLVSLVNQLIMVAADVDNDLFEPGSQYANDGRAVANLTYRVTALFTGRDDVLGASAGLKHFGTRRLGRSGLAVRPPSGGVDNVWDSDCSGFFPDSVDGLKIHGAYFDNAEVFRLMKEILRGTDRKVLDQLGLTKGVKWPPPK
jgi:esterase/lipase superfamily enzyme